MSERRSGILMPVTALPTRYGIGGFSPEAYAFVDRLERAGQKIWQVLPMGPTGYGDSPYQSASAYAGNPYMISLDFLKEEGLLTQQECDAADCGGNPAFVSYEKIYLTRHKVLRKAYERFQADKVPAYAQFIEDNKSWLEDYALYSVIKQEQGGKPWMEWPDPLRLRDEAAIEEQKETMADEIQFVYFRQYLFAKQWSRLKTYANEKGIKILGDIPIYAAMDSADAWADPAQFQFDADMTPAGVAGCPPDAYAVDGQLWGNPLYDWPYHKETGYSWWISRMRHIQTLYDIVRIDHFRGFEAYYSVPYGEPTARNGHWEPGPGMDIFRALEAALGKMDVVAEDLGFLTDSVREMVRESGYPGMKVLQFAFGDSPYNEYLPHNHIRNCIVYTGTHDNETSRGWFKSMPEYVRKYCLDYLGCPEHTEEQFAEDMIRTALSSVADTAVIPMQDYLNLDNSARINEPSTLGGINWCWRMQPGAFTDELADRIRRLTERYGRC